MRHVYNLRTIVITLLFVLNTFAINQLKAEDNRYSDSVALAELYFATDGPNWKNSSTNNWLVEGKSLETWTGVTLTDGRVSSISLANNQLNGSIPSAIGNLTKLTTLYLYNNLLSGSIPLELGNLPLSKLQVYSNKFCFSDFAFIAPDKTGFLYSPQTTMPAPEKTVDGNRVTLSVSDNHPTNHYTWYVNGVQMNGLDASTYTFTPTETTKVYVKITNTTYTKLTLRTAIISVEPIAMPSVVVNINQPLPVCEPLTVNLTASEITLGSTDGLTFTYFSDAKLENEITSLEASAISVSGTYYIKGEKEGLIDTNYVNVSVNPKPTLTGQITPVTCTGGDDGSVDLVVTKGTSPFSYEWSNDALTEDIYNLITGTYEVTVTDANNCENFTSFFVDQNNSVAPIAIAQNITVQLDADGKASITAAQIDNGSSVGCGIASISVSPSSFISENIGENTVTLTVTDNSGKLIFGYAVVTVEDVTAPIALAKNITVQLDENGNASIIADQINDGSSDNSDSFTLAISMSDFNASNLGTNTVTLTVTDNSGNSSSANAVVTVEDVTAPVALAKNITVQLDENGNASITADQINDGSSDNSGSFTLAISTSDFDASNLGTNTVILTVTDNSGNSSSANAVVTVEDVTAPVVLTKNITVQLDENGNVSIIADQINDGSSDNSGSFTLAISMSDFNASNLGTNTVTLTVTDNSGNSSSATAVVTVEDVTAPVVLTKNITVQLDENGNVSITADQINDGSSDNSDSFTLAISTSDFDASNLGTNTVILTVTDNSGNSSSATAVVTVEDVIYPVALAKNITVQLDENGNVSIIADQINDGSSDNSGSFTLAISMSDFNASNLGTNTVTLTVTDNSGNSSSATAVVTVEDVTAPVVLTKNITVQLDENGNVSITADQINDGSSDNSGSFTLAISVSDFSCSNIGDNIVKLTVTDKSGNSSNAMVAVTVQDKVAPEAIAQNITIHLNSLGEVTITGSQINNGSSDACGIKSLEVYPSTFDYNDTGDNDVTLTVTDLNNNVSTANAIVTVIDRIPPTAVAQDIIVQLDSTGTATITAEEIDNGSSDASGIASEEVSPSSFNCSNVGSNFVILTVTDMNGNISTDTVTITILDEIAPVAMAKNITVQLDENGTASVTAAQINDGSMDACGIALLEVSPSVFDCSKIGANTVTLTVTDENGNSSTANAVVTVEDKIAPSIIAPPSIAKSTEANTSDCEKKSGCGHMNWWDLIFNWSSMFGWGSTSNCGQTSGEEQANDNGSSAIELGEPVVSDNCSVWKVFNNAPSDFQTGVTVVTWTVTDVNGNSSSATQTVTITDNGETTNKLPVINSITSNSPVYVMNSATVTASFTDDNLTIATWSWGDGSDSAGTISGKQIKGSHKYNETGLYDVTLTIEDKYGKTATMVYSYIVVFDPANGDVTGGGWFNSEKGDYQLKSVGCKANFGFVAQYDKQMNLKGNLTFHLNNAKFCLNSTRLDWLLINDDQAIIRGKASVNCIGGYEFQVNAVDVDIHSGCHKNKDILRIIVWDYDGEVIYDNEFDNGIYDRPSDEIGSGSIVIHKGKSNCNNGYKSLDLAETTDEIINTEMFANLKVYPNPASKELYIEIPERSEQAVRFDIVDVTGRIVTRDVNLELYGQNGWIDLEPFSMKPGFYILQLKEIDGTQSAMFRFMKK